MELMPCEFREQKTKYSEKYKYIIVSMDCLKLITGSLRKEISSKHAKL